MRPQMGEHCVKDTKEEEDLHYYNDRDNDMLDGAEWYLHYSVILRLRIGWMGESAACNVG